MCTSFNSYVDENKESSNITADLTLPNNKIHPNSIFSLMKMDKLLRNMIYQNLIMLSSLMI